MSCFQELLNSSIPSGKLQHDPGALGAERERDVGLFNEESRSCGELASVGSGGRYLDLRLAPRNKLLDLQGPQAKIPSHGSLVCSGFAGGGS